MSGEVEIRVDLDRQYSDVIDAVAKARSISRTQMCLQILKEWSEQKRHERTLVHRLTRVTGVQGAAEGSE